MDGRVTYPSCLNHQRLVATALVEDGARVWRCLACDADMTLSKDEQRLRVREQSIEHDSHLAVLPPVCESHRFLVGQYDRDKHDLLWTCQDCGHRLYLQAEAMNDYVQTVDQGRPALLRPDDVTVPEPLDAEPAPTNVVTHPRAMEVGEKKLRIQCCGQCGGTAMNIYTTQAHPGSKHFAIAIHCADAKCLAVMMEQSA